MACEPFSASRTSYPNGTSFPYTESHPGSSSTSITFLPSPSPIRFRIEPISRSRSRFGDNGCTERKTLFFVKDWLSQWDRRDFRIGLEQEAPTIHQVRHQDIESDRSGLISGPWHSLPPSEAEWTSNPPFNCCCISSLTVGSSSMIESSPRNHLPLSSGLVC